MKFALDKLGTWSDETEFTVDAERVEAYAAATNDPIGPHRGGELAPPVFAIVPVWEPITLAVGAVTPVEAAFDVLHGEQDMYLHRPLVPGMVVRARGAPVFASIAATARDSQRGASLRLRRRSGGGSDA